MLGNLNPEEVGLGTFQKRRDLTPSTQLRNGKYRDKTQTIYFIGSQRMDKNLAQLLFFFSVRNNSDSFHLFSNPQLQDLKLSFDWEWKFQWNSKVPPPSY